MLFSRSPWLKWPVEAIIKRHADIHKFLDNDPVVKDVHRLYQVLDTKSSALFTHVSIMIAACTFLAGSPQFETEKTLFLGLTALYLGIAIYLLRVVNFNMYDIADKDIEDVEAARHYFAKAAQKRGAAHRRALNVTWGLTVVAVALILDQVAHDNFGVSASSKLKAAWANLVPFVRR